MAWGLYESSLVAPTTASATPPVSEYSISTYLLAQSASRTQGAGGNLRKMTFNFWVKCGASTNAAVVASASGGGAGTAGQIAVIPGGGPPGNVAVIIAGGGFGFIQSNGAVDITDSNWHQITIQLDTDQAVAADRCKIFAGGIDISVTAIPIAINTDLAWNENGIDEVVISGAADVTHAEAILTDDLAKIDGSVLPFTAFSSGGSPIDISGLTFGPQGWWLKFNTGVAATVGEDSSGNNNDFTNTGYVNGDFSTDVPS